MTEIPDWQEYCDLVEPDVDLLKTVLEDTNRNKFHDHVALEAVKPHHPKTFGWCFCRRVPRFQLRPNDRLPYLTIRPKPEFWQLKLLIHFLG